MSKKKSTKKKTARGPQKPKQALPEPLADDAFGFGQGAMSCRIEPDPHHHDDREIPGTMSDEQLGRGIRRMCGQSFVAILWNCRGRMYVRAVSPENDLDAAMGDSENNPAVD